MALSFVRNVIGISVARVLPRTVIPCLPHGPTLLITSMPSGHPLRCSLAVKDPGFRTINRQKRLVALRKLLRQFSLLLSPVILLCGQLAMTWLISAE